VSTTDGGGTTEAWDDRAGYDSSSRWRGVTGERGASASLAARQRFLDVAAGPGGLSPPAARLGAKVLATDIGCDDRTVEARVVRKAFEAEGRVMDAHALESTTTASIHRVAVRGHARQTSRCAARDGPVTKPGGRVLLIAYGPPAEFETLQFFIAALQAVVPDFEGLPDDPPPLEFQVADSEVLRQRLTDAGLHNVTVDATHEERVEFRSGEELWNWVLGSNPIATTIVGDLPEDQQATVRQVLDGMLRERSGGNGSAVLTAPLNIGVGTK
jgi:hypothetical protein